MTYNALIIEDDRFWADLHLRVLQESTGSKFIPTNAKNYLEAREILREAKEFDVYLVDGEFPYRGKANKRPHGDRRLDEIERAKGTLDNVVMISTNHQMLEGAVKRGAPAVHKNSKHNGELRAYRELYGIFPELLRLKK